MEWKLKHRDPWTIKPGQKPSSGGQCGTWASSPLPERWAPVGSKHSLRSSKGQHPVQGPGEFEELSAPSQACRGSQWGRDWCANTNQEAGWEETERKGSQASAPAPRMQNEENGLVDSNSPRPQDGNDGSSMFILGEARPTLHSFTLCTHVRVPSACMCVFGGSRARDMKSVTRPRAGLFSSASVAWRLVLWRLWRLGSSRWVPKPRAFSYLESCLSAFLSAEASTFKVRLVFCLDILVSFIFRYIVLSYLTKHWLQSTGKTKKLFLHPRGQDRHWPPHSDSFSEEPESPYITK